MALWLVPLTSRSSRPGSSPDLGHVDMLTCCVWVLVNSILGVRLDEMLVHLRGKYKYS